MTGFILASTITAVDAPLSIAAPTLLNRPRTRPNLYELTAVPYGCDGNPCTILHRHPAELVASVEPVPDGVPAGPTDVLLVLDELVPQIERWRRILVGLPTPGFLVTAADAQRAAEVLRLLSEASAILAERA